MGEEILSRDELDALMDGVKSGDIATEAGAMAPGEVRAHDFARRDRSLQGRLPGLDQILERAARQLRDNYYRMLRRRPDLPRYMKGGLENPLGARAMYLGGSIYRIHGSNEPETIGTAVSSGCIRMTNEDVTDLYERVKVGTRVVVQR